MVALTVILVVCMAAHPELRLLAPIIDALGVDMLIALTSFQLVDAFSSVLKPYLLLIKSSPAFVASVDFIHSFLLLFDPGHYLFGTGFVGRFLHAQLTSRT